MEREFALWLDQAADVLAFAKNETAIHFDMEYISEKGGLRSYRPDFLIRVPGGNYIIETKGWEDLEVARKDLRAIQWCNDASTLSGEPWQYLKVREAIFRGRQWRSLTELAAAMSHDLHIVFLGWPQQSPSRPHRRRLIQRNFRASLRRGENSEA